MSLRIETDKEIYHDDDIIRGNVILYSNTVETINSAVIVKFLGTSNVKLLKDTGTGPRLHLCKQVLFVHSQTIGSGNLTLPASSHIFNFEVPIPDLSDKNQGDDVLSSSKPFHGTSNRHALPPSFEHSVSELEADFTCTIQYSLEAHISRPEALSTPHEDFRAQTAITYCSARPHLEMDKKLFRQTFTAKTLRLLPGKVDARLSMRERIKSTFQSSELPFATFHSVLWLPTAITKASTCPISISIRYGETTAPQHPVIRLRTVKIIAHRDVVVRTRSLVGDYRVGHMSPLILLEKRNLDIALPAGLSDTTPSDENNFNLSDLGIDTNALYVDFATCNISVSTKLEVELQVVCADRKFIIHGGLRLRVLSPAKGDDKNGISLHETRLMRIPTLDLHQDAFM